MAFSIIIIVFVSKISSDLMSLGEYRYIANTDVELSSMLLNAMILSNEGNVTLYSPTNNIKFLGKIVFRNDSVKLVYKNKSKVHIFNNVIFSNKSISEISKISCIKKNGKYIINVQ